MAQHTVAANEIAIKALRCPEGKARRVPRRRSWQLLSRLPVLMGLPTYLRLLKGGAHTSKNKAGLVVSLQFELVIPPWGHRMETHMMTDLVCQDRHHFARSAHHGF